MKPFVAGVAAAASALVFVTAAGAGPPQEATGTGAAGAPVLTNIRLADGNLLADFTQNGALTGTFSGTFETTGQLIVYPDGRVYVHGLVTFTGATACGSGTVPFVGNDQTVGGVGTGTVMTVEGVDNTADIHAVVDLALAGPTFTYSGSYHCGN
jgi:hypothetical protein